MLFVPRRFSGLGHGLRVLLPPKGVVLLALLSLARLVRFRPNGDLANGEAVASEVAAGSLLLLVDDLVGVLARLAVAARVLRAVVGEGVDVVSFDGDASNVEVVLELGEKKFRKLVFRCSRTISSSLSESSRTVRFLRGGIVK